MNELKKMLAENAQAKEEFENIIEVLNLGATGEIKRLLRHIEQLEEMIENGESREEILKVIDAFNGWTQWMRADGLLKEDETWWESIVERERREEQLKILEK